MQLTLAKVLLTAVASSLATAGALELLRAEPRNAPLESAVRSLAKGPSTSRAPRAATLRVPALSVPLDPDLNGRLRLLEERIDALERSRARQPISPAADARVSDNLRERVLDWVSEEREARRREAEQDEEEERRKEREFEIRVEARKLAEEHELPDWEEENLVAVWFEIETQREELHAGFDRLTSDPADVERQLAEFEEWITRRAIEELGPERANELFGF